MSVPWACFKAGRRIYPQFQRKLNRSPRIIVHLRSYIQNSTQCFIRYPDTSKLVLKNFFNPLLSVWISDETLRVVLDILLPQWFVCLPSLAVPEECIKVDAAATSLFRRDGPYITQLFEGNYFSNAARSRITTNLQQDVRDYVYTFMYPAWRVHFDWKHF